MQPLVFFFVLLCISLISFGQDSFTKDELLRNYPLYAEKQYNIEINKKSNVELKLEYKYIQTENREFLPPGDYLIKAKNQILTGFAFQVVSGAIIYASSSVYTNKIADAKGAKEITELEKERNVFYIGAGALSFLGLCLEISGIVNIGKAGVSLNENGIGVKVTF